MSVIKGRCFRSCSKVNVNPVSDEWAKTAHIDNEKYQEMYRRSVEDPEGFWGEHGKRVDWIKPYSTVKNTSYDYDNVSIKWYEDGTLNVCANCVDRHVATRGNQTAIIWEGDDPNDDAHITYNQLYEHVCKFANVLKANGVKKGDRVTIYMPMVPEARYAMLACARIGAVHSVVFGGFSPDSRSPVASQDCEIDLRHHGGRRHPRRPQGPAEGATPTRRSRSCPGDQEVCIVVKRTGGDIGWATTAATSGGTRRWSPASRPTCPPEEMKAEDPLFILYTSGSTGQAQGRAAHHRRLHGLRVDDPPVCLRLSRRRHLLVHGGCRLGHRPQLHRLRTAGERRDHA